ncbi:MAG: hypothetical protein QF531_04515 [Candidatus Poseidonia sp.]|nr:hypothetical protein [Poseidonia sp.]
MTKRSSSVFDDLASLETTEVESMYEQVIERLSEAEETLVGLHVQKKLHSETIKFAVNKLATAPEVKDDDIDELIQLAIEQKKAFDAAIQMRDELVQRLVVPRHRVAHTLADFYNKLTTDDSLSLAQEMEMFARFFELQTMLSIYNEHQSVLSDANRTRLNLLETIKSVNKNDRKLAQKITQSREAAKDLRNEAGRLRAYLKKHQAAPDQPLPPPTPEMNERLLAGQALSMEEFAAMLEHGGLTDVGATTTTTASSKKKREPNMRKADPRRGKRRPSNARR